MSNSVNWLNLPDVIFCEIVTKISRESLTTLRTCTEVCSMWEEKIMNSMTFKNIRDNIEKALGDEFLSDEEITYAIWLSKYLLFFVGFPINRSLLIKKEKASLKVT